MFEPPGLTSGVTLAYKVGFWRTPFFFLEHSLDWVLIPHKEMKMDSSLLLTSVKFDLTVNSFVVCTDHSSFDSRWAASIASTRRCSAGQEFEIGEILVYISCESLRDNIMSCIPLLSIWLCTTTICMLSKYSTEQFCLTEPYQYVVLRRRGLMVSVLTSKSSSLGSNPGQGHCVVFLGKTFYSHSASSTQVFK